jgi:hypothetical protein
VGDLQLFGWNSKLIFILSLMGLKVLDPYHHFHVALIHSKKQTNHTYILPNILATHHVPLFPFFFLKAFLKVGFRGGGEGG